jgi:transcription factor IIIB subunit 2
MAPKAATPARRANPLKDRPPIKAPPPIHRNRTPAPKSRQKVCLNKQCNSTSIEEGACTECGYMLNEVNIVSEVSFGETSSGAAMVQGTYLSADQGGAVSMGIGGRGDGGGSRQKTLLDGESGHFVRVIIPKFFQGGIS